MNTEPGLFMPHPSSSQIAPNKNANLPCCQTGIVPFLLLLYRHLVCSTPGNREVKPEKEVFISLFSFSVCICLVHEHRMRLLLLLLLLPDKTDSLQMINKNLSKIC